MTQHERNPRLRALVAKWRELADFAEKHLAFNIKNNNIDDDAQIRALRDCAAELDALLSAPVVVSPEEAPPGLNAAQCDKHGAYWARCPTCEDADSLQRCFQAAPVVTQEGEEPCP